MVAHRQQLQQKLDAMALDLERSRMAAEDDRSCARERGDDQRQALADDWGAYANERIEVMRMRFELQNERRQIENARVEMQQGMSYSLRQFMRRQQRSRSPAQ